MKRCVNCRVISTIAVTNQRTGAPLPAPLPEGAEQRRRQDASGHPRGDPPPGRCPMRPKPQPRFLEWTQCFISRLRYDYEIARGRLYVPEDASVDMNGAIRLFRGIDREVRCIDVYERNRVDVLYTLSPIDGQWVAILMGPKDNCSAPMQNKEA